VRKLLLLLLLIPVLSWGDCPPSDETPWIGYVIGHDGQRNELPNNIKEYQKKLHCEFHRCSEINDQTPSCVCENFGGAIPLTTAKNAYTCSDGYRDIEGITENPLTINFFSENTGNIYGIKSPHYSEKPITPANPTPTPAPKTSITDAKAQCTDIGFKAGTEKFGDCVLELMQ